MLETLTALSSAITSFKAVVDVVPRPQRKKVQEAIQEHVLEARELIVKAREEAQTAKEAIAALRREKEALDAWQDLKKRYVLNEPHPGKFVMALRSIEARDEPPHWLCAACFGERRVSILQVGNQWPDRTLWSCGPCGIAKSSTSSLGLPPTLAPGLV